MMKKQKTNIIVCLFLLFLAVCIIGTTVTIFNTPVEVTSSTAGNFTVNLSNGGYVLEDNGFLFFTRPDMNGIYRTETASVGKTKQISQSGSGFLQRVDRSYYYADKEKLMSCDVDGNGKRVVIEYAKKPLVCGATVFYLDKENNLCKYSFQNKTEKTVIEREKSAVNEFTVYYKRIYYTDAKGNIRKSSFDGRENSLFLEADATNISIDGQYIFYISDGSVWSAMLSDDKMVKAKIVNATEYAVYGEYIVYTDGKTLNHADINALIKNPKKAKIASLYKGNADGISIDDDYFYYFNAEGELIRVTRDGKTQTTIPMKGGE